MPQLLAAEGGYQVFDLAGRDSALLVASLVIALLAIAVGFPLMRGVLAADQGTPKPEGDRRSPSRRGPGPTSSASSRRSAMIVVPLAVDRVRDVHRDPQARRQHRPVLRAVGPVPHPGLPRRWLPVGPHRLHRHDPGHARQRAHRRRGQRAGLAAGRAAGGVPHRRHRRHVHRGPGPARRHRSSSGSSRTRRRPSWSASGSAARCSPCSCGSAAASSPRRPTSAPTWSARSRRASPRTTPATRPPSPTTWATTSATAPGWPPTCSRLRGHAGRLDHPRRRRASTRWARRRHAAYGLVFPLAAGPSACWPRSSASTP